MQYSSLNNLWHFSLVSFSLEFSSPIHFQFCGYCWVFQICCHIECSTSMASSFRIWNSSTGIPSPLLALRSSYSHPGCDHFQWTLSLLSPRCSCIVESWSVASHPLLFLRLSKVHTSQHFCSQAASGSNTSPVGWDNEIPHDSVVFSVPKGRQHIWNYHFALISVQFSSVQSLSSVRLFAKR